MIGLKNDPLFVKFISNAKKINMFLIYETSDRGFH